MNFFVAWELDFTEKFYNWEHSVWYLKFSVDRPAVLNLELREMHKLWRVRRVNGPDGFHISIQNSNSRKRNLKWFYFENTFYDENYEKMYSIFS